VTEEVTDQAVRNLESLTAQHDQAMSEIGKAHRAAANHPDRRRERELQRIENEEKAKLRHERAMKKQRAERKRKKESESKLIRLRENIRLQEDCKAKCLVERRPFHAKNVETKPERYTNYPIRLVNDIINIIRKHFHNYFTYLYFQPAE
jgi:hypothetical protein